MKPLKPELIGDFTPRQYRECLIDLAKGVYGCCVKYKDGTFHQITLNSNDEIIIEKYDPWFEFYDEEELRGYIQTDNETFDNLVRLKKLQDILNDDDIDPFKK